MMFGLFSLSLMSVALGLESDESKALTHSNRL